MLLRGRERGRAWLGPAFDYLLFLRPRQWPILTFQLAVAVLAAPACVAALQGTRSPAPDHPPWPTLILVWLAWVVCLNGGTLAFNSAFDRDEADIAYLRRPPPPPPHLAVYSLALMIAGGGLAFLVHPWFGWVTCACVLLSVLYSHPRPRWKGIAGVDLAVNMLGYGAGTTLAGLLAGQVILPNDGIAPAPSGWWLVAAFACLFGSLYPLTQIYQLVEDRARGDRTLAAALGARPSLVLALGLGLAATACFLAAATAWTGPRELRLLWPLVLALFAWLGHLGRWLARAPAMSPRDHEQGMYQALVLWVLVDVAVLWCRYGAGGPVLSQP